MGRRGGREGRAQPEQEPDVARTETTEPLGRFPAGEGLLLGRYRPRSRLGAGGFGVVWLAYDERLEREVAVKVIPRADGSEPGRPRRFGRDARAEREARVAARLNHPGIVSLYELGADEEAVYLVSELVRGRTFADLHRAGALSDRDVARVGAALCDALGHAHAKGVVHRDVKPQNIIVVAEPAVGAGFVKLTDFGVAQLAGDEALTRTGDVVGTLAYMAPEQAEGERVGPPADVYALALTLYEGWTGANPLRAPGPAATARRLGRPPRPLRACRRDLPVELGDAIDAALDPWPEQRPGLPALRAALEEASAALSDEGGLVEPATLARVGLPRGRRGRRRGRRLGRRSRLPPADPAPADVPPADLAPARVAPGHAPAGARAGRALGRAAAGLSAGALVLAALALSGAPPPWPPPVAAGAVALGVALAPRLGWIAGAGLALGWAASPSAGNAGAALVAAVALAPTPLLLPRAGVLWSLPALGPLLGAAGLGPAFVGVAALASTPARRAGLGAAGLLWLAAAEAIGGGRLLFGAPAVVAGPAARSGSVAGATEVLAALVASPALAPAAAWAIFAAIAPLAVRRRSLVLDVARGAMWAAGLVAAHAALADLLAGAVGRDGPRGAVAGSALALAVALTGTVVRSRRPATAP